MEFPVSSTPKPPAENDIPLVIQKRSNNWGTSIHQYTNKLPIKALNLQIDFLKSENQSKNAIINMILDHHKEKIEQKKPLDKRRDNNNNNIHDNGKYQAVSP